MNKLFMLDVGIAVRLQGHTNANLLWNSPQMEALFETMVFSKLLKTKDHNKLNWQLFCWRTKEKAVIDFILQTDHTIFFIESKLAIQNLHDFNIDSEAKKVFFGLHTQKIIVTPSSQEPYLISTQTMVIPITRLARYLKQYSV